MVLFNGRSRDFEESFHDFVNGRRGIAVDGLRRILPLGAVNPFRVLNRGRDPRRELLEIIGTLVVVPDMPLDNP